MTAINTTSVVTDEDRQVALRIKDLIDGAYGSLCDIDEIMGDIDEGASAQLRSVTIWGNALNDIEDTLADFRGYLVDGGLIDEDDL